MQVNVFNASVDRICSIEAKPDGIVFVYSSDVNKQGVVSCKFYPYADSDRNSLDQFRKMLVELVASNLLKKTRCNLVLHPSDYKIVVLNTPNVSKEEYQKAVRWQLRDRIDYPLDDLVLDIFYPEDGLKPPKNLYVVAARKSIVTMLATAIQDANLHLQAIDIRQFALRNLACMVSTESLFGMIDLADDSCAVSLVEHGVICFFRRFPIKVNQIHQQGYSEFCVELNKSFNYADSELQIKIPQKLFLLTNGVIENNMSKELSTVLDKNISEIDLTRIIKRGANDMQDPEHQYYSAIGGLLREAWRRV